MMQGHVGFTGTEDGMNVVQLAGVHAWLRSLERGTIGHHGDCVGSDAQFHRMAIALGMEIWLHPPLDESRRAFCQGASQTFPAKPYLVRDRDIARHAEALVATPRENSEVLRSGTWATVREACRLGRTVTLFLPDGSMARAVHLDRGTMRLVWAAEYASR